MRILHLVGASAYPPWSLGGSQIYCHRLCQNLQSLGVEVLVAIHQHASGREPLGRSEYEGIPLQILPGLADASERVALYARATQQAIGFQQLLDHYQPDIVHFHDFTVNAGITHMRLAKQAGCKIVMTYHTPGNSCSQHGLLYRSQHICNGHITLQRCSECRLSSAGLHPVLSHLVALQPTGWLNAHSSHPLKRLLTTRQMTAIFREAWLEMLELVDALHVLAEWVQHLVELNGAPSSKIRFFRTGGPNPIPLPCASNPNSSLADGPLKLVFAGRSTWIKGMHIVVEAIQQLPPSLPIQVTFFRADTTWEEKDYGRHLQPQIEQDQRFTIQYEVPNSQLIQAMTQYDLCLVPSLWLETGPLTVLEAFAAGLPVIGSRLGGIAELVRDGIDGLLFEPGNSQELASILHNIVSDRTLLQRLKQNVRPPRTMKHVAQDTLALYQTL